MGEGVRTESTHSQRTSTTSDDDREWRLNGLSSSFKRFRPALSRLQDTSVIPQCSAWPQYCASMLHWAQQWPPSILHPFFDPHI